MNEIRNAGPRIERLRPTAAVPLPFAPTSVVRAFLLERDEGNLLVYSTPGLEAQVPELRARGGVARHYLGHWHEASLGLAPSLGAELVVHRDDADRVTEAGGAASTFDRRHAPAPDFEVIPVPGHTPGSTAYLWTTGDHRLLFTADTIYLHRGRWRVALLDDSDHAQYLRSLEHLRELDFDVLVPWAVDAADPYLVALDAAERRARIDALLDWVRAA